MKITSNAFEEGEMIPKKYTCEGEDVSPKLEISDPPLGTMCYALIIVDPDAPTEDFVHWLLWNIQPDIEEIMEGTAPIGSIEGANDFGRPGWGGPCPPSGVHRYEFHLYALDRTIELPPMSEKNELRSLIKDYILEEATLVGTYQKQAEETIL